MIKDICWNYSIKRILKNYCFLKVIKLKNYCFLKMEERLKTTFSSVSKVVNIAAAKKVAVVVVMILICINGIRHMHSEPCKRLLDGGTLIDGKHWQPDGCMLHTYKKSETVECLKQHSIAFVGDSRVRELFYTFGEMAGFSQSSGKAHSDISFKTEDINLNFFWIPEINQSSFNLYETWLKAASHQSIVIQAAATTVRLCIDHCIYELKMIILLLEQDNLIWVDINMGNVMIIVCYKKELDHFTNFPRHEIYRYIIFEVEDGEEIPTAFSLLHTIKRTNGSKKGLETYRGNLTKQLDLMQKLTEKGTLIYWMLQEPVLEGRLHIARRAISNEHLDDYNNVALELFETSNGDSRYPGISIVKSVSEVTRQTADKMLDGLHAGDETKRINNEILVNLFCNKLIHPQFGVCCDDPTTFTYTQIIASFLALLCILLALSANLFWKDEAPDKNPESGEVKNSSRAKAVEILNASAKMALILFYFYICDRTNVFMRSNKFYAHVRFFIPLFYVIFLGMFGINQAKSPVLLNRDQTDEWKGWMQLVILIYHITGASSNLGIYMHIRLLVAMYLFMTGYGHFAYFWNRGDFSFYRVFSVLFRLNFLTVLLCIVMNRPYQFYYFVPLCTFWFLVLYLFMAVWPQIVNCKNSATSYEDGTVIGWRSRHCILLMVIKLLVFISVLIFLFHFQSVYDSMFDWWPFVKLFELPGGSHNLHEWWFRSRLDRFALLHGAVFCFTYLLFKNKRNSDVKQAEQPLMEKRVNILDDSKQGCLLSTKVSCIVVFTSITVILSYTIWAMQCTDKRECNELHSYLSFLPITAFILIRNIPGYLRSNYSSFFAWFGKISLELFIGQYHIWLAADTKGVLVLTSSRWPTFNGVVTTFVFVCIAHEINQITGILAKHVVGSSKEGARYTWMRFAATIAVILAITLPGSFV